MSKYFTYYKFACFVTAIAAMFIFSSCGDDDDDDNSCNCNNNGRYTNTVDKAVIVDKKDVMANWIMVSTKDYVISKGKPTVIFSEDYDGEYSYFLHGEMGIFQQIHDGKLSENEAKTTWKYDNGHIIIYYSSEVIYYTIISFSGDEMVLRARTGDETTGAYSDETFKRIDGPIEEYLKQFQKEDPGY